MIIESEHGAIKATKTKKGLAFTAEPYSLKLNHEECLSLEQFMQTRGVFSSCRYEGQEAAFVFVSRKSGSVAIHCRTENRPMEIVAVMTPEASQKFLDLLKAITA